MEVINHPVVSVSRLAFLNSVGVFASQLFLELNQLIHLKPKPVGLKLFGTQIFKLFDKSFTDF